MRSWYSPWLARFSFTFFALGIILLWQAYQANEGRLGAVSKARIILFMVGGMCSFVMGFVGVRERHRSDRDDLP